ncbi:MAG: ATP-binding cassette domain-containing protein [candidate division Zixibacteria bacterium]|nr:ATP-binding cassette domain-containing protein [candidate division Zixibacteria bacterium]
MGKPEKKGRALTTVVASNPTNIETLLRVENLDILFGTAKQHVVAVDGVSFKINTGETLAIVGESGCGKTVTSLSIMGLIPCPPGIIDNGSIQFNGKDLLHLKMEEMRKVRGNDIAMIFQEPMTSLNPVLTVGLQMSEAMMAHKGISRKEARKRAIEMLKLVQIPEPEKRMEQYPHQLSGGMRQRVMIGTALSCEPKILIADEPTTALDVTVQAQILDLMNDIKAKLDTSILFITHDLGVVAEIADRVLVMYAGRTIEEALVTELYENPIHPYTEGLLRAIPRLDQYLSADNSVKEALKQMPGIVPSIYKKIEGCSFAPRCPYARKQCGQERPVMKEVVPGHRAACWKPEW